MAALLYHTTKTLNRVSPFDEAITTIVSGKSIKIACPYLNIYFLEKIARLANDWILLADIDALLHSNIAQTDTLVHFIAKHQPRIKHYPKLHAKVIVSDTQAFLGSANLTDGGIYRNNELSVVLSDADSVAEIHMWFDDWWAVADDIDTKDLSVLARNIIKTPQPAREHILSQAPKIKAKTSQGRISKTEQYAVLLTESAIVAYLERWQKHEWERAFFQLLRTAIHTAGLPNNSEYLAVTLTETQKITFQINNRVILASHSRRKNTSLSLMLPLEFEAQKEAYPNIFSIEYFGHSDKPESLLVRAEWDNLDDIPASILALWKQAIQHELQRKYKSPFKRYHQNILYDIATNDHKLNEIFAMVEGTRA